MIDVFVDELDLGDLSFERIARPASGRPAYHPAVLLKLYVYGYLNRVQSSRRLEREAGRNVEVMWLTGRLSPDHKTIADFRKDNGRAIGKVCSQFVCLCRQLGLFAEASVAIDGCKFKAVNNRDRNFTRAKMQKHTVSTIVAFRIGAKDVDYIEPEFRLTNDDYSLCELSPFEAYSRTGFTTHRLTMPMADHRDYPSAPRRIRNLSRNCYAADRGVVEAKIARFIAGT